jgi:glycosyltransferase involved in cell wall biosynthesis
MISIIIPTLNEEKLLPKLLRSIKGQKVNDCEIIVADAESTDKTREIARSFGAKVVKGGLPARGRNEGAKIARGRYLLFLDADSILPNNFLRKSLKEFKDRKLDIASFGLCPRESGKIIKMGFELFYNRPIFLFQKFLAHGAMAILVKKDIFQKAGGFDESIKLAEDHYFTRQAFKIGKFGIIKSAKVNISMRRFESDGYLLTFLKYFFCYLYMLSGKPVRSDIFKYKFNHYKKK